MKLNYKHTLFACCNGYVVQAIVNCLSPLLFIIYRERLEVELWQISLIILINFTIQTLIDVCSTLFVDRLGYRKCVVFAHIFASLGLVSLGILPTVMTYKFTALLIATILGAMGGGLIEVIISPIVEAIPLEKKAARMNFLHSFYCWGQAGVILITTLFFLIFDRSLWFILPLLWSVVPFFNALLFLFTPISALEGVKAASAVGYLFKSRIFWILMVVMFAAGACELGISQWASLLAEEGFGISKALGDLLGPMMFAVLMGTARITFGIFGGKIKIEKWIFLSFALCVFSYLLTALSPFPWLSLIGCAMSGISVAILWPGTYSLGARELPRGSTATFALFALGGDMGCAIGPAIIGWIADSTGEASIIGMKRGILFTSIIPLIALILIGCFIISKKRRSN